MLNWNPLAATACVAAILVWYKLSNDVTRQKELRQTERQGRIRAELALSKIDGSPTENGCLSLHPIGIVKSVFAKRSGTPRQPGLVGSAEAVIEMDPSLRQAVDSIDCFSHVWIMFVFHQNTNMGKRKKAKKPFDGLKLLVEPPKANGLKVGVLSCRTPHRPNPVGLSLCRLLRVEEGGRRIVVSGLDCLDGTPIVDIKPYLPMIESVPTAMTPQWIFQGIDEDRQVSVEWAPQVRMPSAANVIEETLSCDIRSRHQIELAEQQGSAWRGELLVAGLRVEYSMQDKVVTIRSVNDIS